MPPNEFDNLYDKIMQRRQTDRLKRRIHFSRYWGTYTRVLSFPEENQYQQYIELNLIPVNGISGDWDLEVEPIIFRHFIPDEIRLKRDMFYLELPEPAELLMIENIGPELSSRLLHEKFMDKIDLNKLMQAEGPVNFGRIKKSED
jgi:hypothetical protein